MGHVNGLDLGRILGLTSQAKQLISSYTKFCMFGKTIVDLIARLVLLMNIVLLTNLIWLIVGVKNIIAHTEYLLTNLIC